MTGKRILFIQEFEKLYVENYSRLYTYAYTIVNDADVSKDLVSEVFSKVWDDFDLLDRDRVKGYLLISVRNRCIDRLRMQEKERAYLDFVEKATEWEDTQAEEYESDLQLVERLLDTLPSQTRLVLERCYFNRMKYQEVADELDITPRMVKRHVSNALSALREAFRKKKEGE